MSKLVYLYANNFKILRSVLCREDVKIRNDFDGAPHKIVVSFKPFLLPIAMCGQSKKAVVSKKI